MLDFFRWLFTDSLETFINKGYGKIKMDDPAWFLINDPKRYFWYHLKATPGAPRPLPVPLMGMSTFLFFIGLLVVAHMLTLGQPLRQDQIFFTVIIPSALTLVLALLVLVDVRERRARARLVTQYIKCAASDPRPDQLRELQKENELWNTRYRKLCLRLADKVVKEEGGRYGEQDYIAVTNYHGALLLLNSRLTAGLMRVPVCGGEQESTLTLDPATPANAKAFVIADAEAWRRSWDEFGQIREEVGRIAKERGYVS